MMNRLEQIYINSNAICNARGWKKDWESGGCYIHLEVSEFIEALRGKTKSSPAEEAGDVIFGLLAVLKNYEIPLEEVISMLEMKIEKMLDEDQGRNS